MVRGYFVENFKGEQYAYVYMGGEGKLVGFFNRNIACWESTETKRRTYFKRPSYVCRESLEWNILWSAIAEIEEERGVE